MRNLVVLGASAFVFALGIGSAFAEPSTAQLLAAGQGYSQSLGSAEGRAAAIEAPSANAFIWESHHGR